MTDAPAAGAKAPPFRLPSTRGDVSLDDLLAGDHRLVLAFYTEDATPTCETEVTMLRDAHEVIAEFGARVIAVSADSLDAHRAFEAKLGGLPFPLASDASLEAARAYGVADEETKRARRAAFVIERDGTVLLALPHLQPSNLSQLEAIFAALGMEAEG